MSKIVSNKIVSKIWLFLLLLCLCFTLLPPSPLPATTISSLNLNTEVACKEEQIRIFGQAEPETWLTIKIIDDKGNLVFFDALKTTAGGSFNVDFIVPEVERCTLTIVAGSGANTLSKELIIKAKKKKSSPPKEPAEQNHSEKSLTITLTIGQDTAHINGKPTTLDVVPYLHPQSHRTMLPVRFIGESLGAQVQWLPITKEIIIKKNEQTIILTIDHDVAIINGQYVKIDCPPRLFSCGRTFAPVRFLGESLGACVDWNSETGAITISQ